MVDYIPLYPHDIDSALITYPHYIHMLLIIIDVCCSVWHQIIERMASPPLGVLFIAVVASTTNFDDFLGQTVERFLMKSA